MKMFQFVKYESVVGEKHVGFATIKCNFKFFNKNPNEVKTLEQLKEFIESIQDATEYRTFKIGTGKNGGYYPNMPSFKRNEEYEEACIMDSNFVKNEMKKVIMEGVSEEMGKTGTSKIPMQESIFPVQTSYEPKQTDYCPF